MLTFVHSKPDCERVLQLIVESKALKAERGNRKNYAPLLFSSVRPAATGDALPRASESFSGAISPET